MTSVGQQGPRAPRPVALQKVSPQVTLRILLPLENLTKMGPSVLSQEQRVLYLSMESRLQ